MSTTNDVAELLPGRTVKFDSGGIPIEATREYQVLRAFGATEFSLADITGLPAIAAAHPKYTGLKVNAYDPKEDQANGRRWTITVIYNQKVPTVAVTASGGFKARIIRVRYGTSETQHDFIFDATDGAPLINTAGDPFESVPQVGICDTVVTIERQDNLAPATVLALNGTINESSITIQGVTFAAYTARLTIDGEKLEGTDYPYQWNYTVTGRTKKVDYGAGPVNIGWKEAMVHAGFYYLDTGIRKRAMEIEEGTTPTTYRPTARPILLSDTGARTTTPYIEEFRPYIPASWTALNLNL